MSTVAVLAQVPPPVNEEAVKYLSHMLAMAKSGELQQYAAGYICQDGAMGSSVSVPSKSRVHHLIGAVSHVLHRLQLEQDSCADVNPTTPKPEET